MSNSPLLRLCRHNQNRSLYPAIKILLKRKDIDRRHKNKFGHNALSLMQCILKEAILSLIIDVCGEIKKRHQLAFKQLLKF